MVILGNNYLSNKKNVFLNIFKWVKIKLIYKTNNEICRYVFLC